MSENKNQFFNFPPDNDFTQSSQVSNTNPNNQLNYDYQNQSQTINPNYQNQQMYNQNFNINQSNPVSYEPLTPINQVETIAENDQIEELESLDQIEQPLNNNEQNTFVAATVTAAPENPAAPVEMVETTPVLDPLNNANNPVPVNPVAPPDTKRKVVAVAVSPLAPLGSVLDMIKKPGKLIEETIPKYEHFISSIMYTAFLTVVSLVLTLLARLIVGGFIKTYNNASGSYSATFDFANIANQNFVHYLLIALIVSGIAIIGVAVICYASSFLNSKGLTLGKILMITNVSFIPLIMGVNVIMPILNIISDSVGFASLIISIIYTIILFVTGMNHYIQTDKLNTKIVYNLINFVIIVAICVLIITLMYPGLSIINAISIGF